MMLTLFLLSLFTLFIATSSEPAQAQESSNQRRIGFLSSGFFPLHYSSFTAFTMVYMSLDSSKAEIFLSSFDMAMAAASPSVCGSLQRN